MTTHYASCATHRQEACDCGADQVESRAKTPAVESPCCKCTAYREIIAENAAELARARKAVVDIRRWMKALERYCDEAEKP